MLSYWQQDGEQTHFLLSCLLRQLLFPLHLIVLESISEPLFFIGFMLYSCCGCLRVCHVYVAGMKDQWITPFAFMRSMLFMRQDWRYLQPVMIVLNGRTFRGQKMDKKNFTSSKMSSSQWVLWMRSTRIQWFKFQWDHMASVKASCLYLWSTTL